MHKATTTANSVSNNFQQMIQNVKGILFFQRCQKFCYNISRHPTHMMAQ